MANHIAPDKIEQIFKWFWDKTYGDIYTTMAGMADIWEGPGGYQNAYAGASTILGMQFYEDTLYVVQGGGLQTFIKVFSPNGIEIHMLGAQACLMTHTPLDVYGSICVINKNELIVGYLYVNLEMQFATPYGLDLAQLWDNNSVKITSARVSSIAWVTAIRSAGSTQFFLHQKANPEDCLPCSVRQSNSSGSAKVSCIEEEYSRQPMGIESYVATRSMMANGANASITDMGGVTLLDKKTRPVADAAECLLAIGEYQVLFNRKKISPRDIGIVGQKLSRSCSSTMYGNMLQIVEYKSKAEDLHDRLLEQIANGVSSSQGQQGGQQPIDVGAESAELVGLISPVLMSINKSSDSPMLKELFRDQIWWGPIWFSLHQTEIENIENPYTLLQSLSFDDFIDMLTTAAAAIPSPTATTNLPMGWIMVSDADTAPVKYSRKGITYFRFPFSLCMSTTKLFTIGERDIDSICDVETRPDGVLVWGWKDRSTLGNRMYMELKCYKISNDGVASLLSTFTLGYDMTPLDNRAMAVGVGDGYWIVRDFYIVDSEAGGIAYVDTKVNMSADMKNIIDQPNASNYANVNEISGMEAGTVGTIHYSDGLLERNYGDYDLDDGFVGIPAWGNDGKQFDWVKGYSGYQIHSPDLL